MQKCFLLAVCLMQQVFLIAQTAGNLQHVERSMLEAKQTMDLNTGKVPVDRLYDG